MNIETSANEYFGLLSVDAEGAMRKFYADDVKMKMNWNLETEEYDLDIEGIENAVQAIIQFTQGLKSHFQQQVLALTFDQEQNASQLRVRQQYSHQEFGDVNIEALLTHYWENGKIIEERFEVVPGKGE